MTLIGGNAEPASGEEKAVELVKKAEQEASVIIDNATAESKALLQKAKVRLLV